MFMAQFYSWKRHVLFLLALVFAGSVSVLAQVNLTITTVNGSFPSEVGWQIVNQSTNVVYNCEPTGGTIQNNVTISVPAGNYEIRAWDSFGDTWNNATITLKYTVNSVTLVNAATMTLRLRSSNSCPGPTAITNAAQRIATFTVVPPCVAPTITTQPGSQTICLGQPVTFSVVSSMTSGTYEWRRAGATLATTSTNSYTIPSVSATDAGLYDVILRDNCNPSIAFTTSSSALLTVATAPVITVHPTTSRVVCENANDTLRVRASGNNRTYQWRLNGIDISGARDSNYVIVNMGTANEGVYDCVVSGLCSPSATSNPCSITAAMRPRLTTQPVDIDVCPSTTASISVSATGTNLVYQWFKDGVAIPNATNPTLIFTSYGYASNGAYHCNVTSNIVNPNNCPVTVPTRVVRVSGIRPPSITAQPKSGDVCVGSRLSLLVETKGSGLVYQWFKDGVALANSNTNEFLISSVTKATSGDYTVRVTGTCGLNETSTVAKVTAIAKPVFSKQPTSQELEVGARLELTVDASDWRSIQWTKNDKPIDGATGPSYVIEKVGKSDAGYYNALVRNPCGALSSAYARVDVKDAVAPSPVLELSTASVDFGEIPVGYDKSLTLNGLIKNVGTAPLVISGFNTVPNDYSITDAPSLPLTLEPGASTGLTIKASPADRGTVTGSLNVLSNAPLSPTAAIALSAAYVLRYEHSLVEDFGTILTDTTHERCIAIKNASAQDITIEQAILSGVNAGQFEVLTTLPLSIAAGQTADLCVKFTPGSPGAKTATLSLRSANGGNSTVAVQGSGEAPGGVVDAEEAGVSAWPNPMTDRVEVHFAHSTPSMDVSVVGSTGITVAAFSHDGVDAGGSIRWNGRDASGASIASGSYTMIIRYSETLIAVPITIAR